MPTTRYQQSLSSLIDIHNLPLGLDLIRDLAATLLDDVYFDNLEILYGAHSGSREYNLDIIINKQLGLDIPGTGAALLLNPDLSGAPQSSSFNTTFRYTWNILDYIGEFNLDEFSFAPEDIIALLKRVFNVSDETLLEQISAVLENPDGWMGGARFDVDEWVEILNDYFDLTGSAGEITYSSGMTCQDLENALLSAGITIADFIDHFEVTTDYPGGSDTIEDVFNRQAIVGGIGALALRSLIERLNDDLGLTGTAGEIPSSAATYEDVISYLASAAITIDQVILQYLVPDPGLEFDDILDALTDFFGAAAGTLYISDIKNLLVPTIGFSINNIRLALEFPESILQPLDSGGNIIPGETSKLLFNVGRVSYSTDEGFEFENESTFIFTKSQILHSGFTLEILDAKLDLSRTDNIPEAIADQRPEDFIGAYIREGTIGFPLFWSHDASGSTGTIKARNLLIGTGGISGTFALEANSAGDPTPVVKVKFGDNFSVSLDVFSITFKQNAITASEIEGTLRIPGFKDTSNNPADIRIKVAIRDDGDFDITAYEDDGFKEIKFGDIFSITLKSIYFGKKDDDFYMGVSGSIKFLHPLLSNIFKDAIEVEKLIIWSDGRFEIEGGTLPLPQNFRFPIGPAEISITALHFGSHQQEGPGGMRNYRYFGFDGGVDINPGGVDVRGKGIKFYYTVDDGPGKPSDRYLEIKSIAIDLVIPGNASRETATLLVSGFLNINGTAADPEYEGGVSFALPKVKIAGGAAMKYKPKEPAFIVDAFVELSSPILLGSTGLGIYGFRGLFGHRYVATKHAAGLTDSDTWFQYYKAPPSEGVVVSKFETPDETKDYDNPFSIGAGVSLATVPDSGRTFSTKLFLLLSLPELIYLEGKANVLGGRVGLTGDDPPFFAYLALSPQSIETGFGADYNLPKSSGAILDVYAEIQAAFFFQNSSAWYVNFGTEDKRISARVLSLFNATAYVMLSASGIAAGAGVNFGFSKSYAGGMVRASVGVYIEVGGRISFERPQIGGFAMVGGHVDAYLLFVGFHISIDTSLSVEVPHPFIIAGSVRLCVGVTIGFWKFKKRIEKCFQVEFKWEKDPNSDLTPVIPFDIVSLAARPPLKGANMLSGESFDVKYFGTSLPSAGSALFDQAVLPLDTWVDLEFLKGLLPAAGVDARIGRLSGQAPANYIDLVPPAEVPRKVKHEYTIKAMEIKAWNGSAWVDYRPYQAMSVPAALAALGANPSAYKDGFWQNSGSGFSKLRLLAETSLSYMEQGQPGWYIPEQFGITSATLFCRTKLKTGDCVRWVSWPPGTVFPDGHWQQANALLYRVVGGDGIVYSWSNPFGIAPSLLFRNDDVVQIILNKPSVQVSLKLTSFAQGVEVRFYKREVTGLWYAYSLVETRTLTPQQLMVPVVYDNPSTPIAKVEIDPMNGDPAAIYALQVQIDGLYRQLYERNLSTQEREALMRQISGLEAELAQLQGVECGHDNPTYEQLVQQRDSVSGQLAACQSELQQLTVQQNSACQGKGYYDDRFAVCYWYYPVTVVLGYWIYEYWYQGVFGYRFHIYDDELYIIVLSGVVNYPTVEAADGEMYLLLERLISGELQLIPTQGEFGFSFVLGYSPNQYFAYCPRYFAEPYLRDAFMEQVLKRITAAYVDGNLTLFRRAELVLLNYWIYEYWYDGIPGYGYHIYDVDLNLIVLSGVEVYSDQGRADGEMHFMLERLLSGELKLIRTFGESGFSFVIGYSPDQYVAYCPQYFTTPYLRDSFVAQVWEKLMTIFVQRRIMLVRRTEIVIISYWIYEYWENDVLGYRYHIYDDAPDFIILSGVESYTTAEIADSEMYTMLERLIGGSVQMIPIQSDLGFSFVIGYSPDQYFAYCPRYFDAPHLRDAFMSLVWGRLMAIYIGGRFILLRRWGLPVVCPVPLSNLVCWREMGVYAVNWGYSILPMVDYIEAIQYGACFDIRLAYHDLYFANRDVRDYLDGRCTYLSQQVSAKTAQCQALSGQLAELEAMIAAYIPPPSQYPCATLLHEVCFLSLEDHQFNLTVPGQAAIESDYQNAIAAIEKMLTPIWRPDTKYSIRLQVTDRVNDGASTDFEFYFGFRTAGPVGYFHTDPSAGYVDTGAGRTPDQYMLTGLKGYIDYQRSYPNADGELIRAKPLFYEDARILLFFTKRYVYHFFGEWPAYNGLPAITGGRMQVVVKDPSEDISMENPPPPLVTNTEIPQAVVAWPSDDDPRIPEDIRTLLNLRNPELLNPDFVGGDCWVSGGDMIKPASVYTQITPQYLKPLKLYTAIINNIYKGDIREVHRYVFQTSRYADFAAQVNSYQLGDTDGNQRSAIFQLEIPLTTGDITLMYDIVTDNMSGANATLAGTWADPFDRLVEGALKLPPLDAAISTEFNIVRNANTSAVAGVWIRNPEPFNDPKLPDDVLARSLRVMNGSTPDLNYKVMFSKDRSQAFVMHSSTAIPVTQMKFRFAYIEWDGSTYVDHTVITTGFIDMNY